MTAPPPDYKVRPRRILVVDDEPLVLDSIRMLFELDGHQVETANNPRAALKNFAPGKFDLVVTDFQMPDMVGTEFVRAIRELSPGQRILMISAYTESLTQSGRTPEGVDMIINKPFSLAALRQALANLTGPS